MTDERTATAWHEAGHAVAAYVLGGPVELVSIRPNRHYLGMAWCDGPTWSSAGFRPERPVSMQPRELRAGIERDIIVRLSGPAAERLAPPTPGHVPELVAPDVYAAESDAESLASLISRDDLLQCADRSAVHFHQVGDVELVESRFLRVVVAPESALLCDTGQGQEMYLDERAPVGPDSCRPTGEVGLGHI